MSIEHLDKRYYETNYPDYQAQTSEKKLRFYMDLVRKYTPARGNVFELGVAMGDFIRLAEKDFVCFGSDINSYGVEEARKKARSAQLYNGSTETLDLVKSDLDTIVAWDVLEHLPDLNSGMAKIRNRLKPNGHLIGVVPIYDGSLGWLVDALDKDPTHVTKVGRQDWIRMLESQNFEVVEWGGILRKLIGKSYVHITQPHSVLKVMCSAMYFVGRKSS